MFALVRRSVSRPVRIGLYNNLVGLAGSKERKEGIISYSRGGSRIFEKGGGPS